MKIWIKKLKNMKQNLDNKHKLYRSKFIINFLINF